jgi:hypothetical protein
MLCALVVTGGGAAAAVHTASPVAKVKLSSRTAGARSVELTIVITTTLRCGLPFGPTVVDLPRQFEVPSRILRSAVRENDLAPAGVTVAGHEVTVSPPTVGVTCQSLTTGPETLVFGAAARLGNPSTAGTYVVTLDRGSRTYRGAFTITRR